MNLTTLYCLLTALVAGGLLPLQSAINTTLARWTSQPVISALVSFLVGTVGLVIFAVATGAFNGVNRIFTTGSSSIPWWAWIGGLFGAFYVASAVTLLPRLGSATFVAVVITGQLFTAMILDHYGLLGMPVHSFSIARLIGAFLLIGGVLVIQRF